MHSLSEFWDPGVTSQSFLCSQTLVPYLALPWALRLPCHPLSSFLDFQVLQSHAQSLLWALRPPGPSCTPLPGFLDPGPMLHLSLWAHGHASPLLSPSLGPLTFGSRLQPPSDLWTLYPSSQPLSRLVDPLFQFSATLWFWAFFGPALSQPCSGLLDPVIPLPAPIRALGSCIF